MGACAKRGPVVSRLRFLLCRFCTRCQGTIVGAAALAIEANRFRLGELSHNMAAAANMPALRRPTLLHQPPLHALDDAARPHTSYDRQRNRNSENHSPGRRSQKPGNGIGTE